MLTKSEAQHRALRVAGNLAAVVLWAAVLATIAVAVLAGCAEVQRAPQPGMTDAEAGTTWTFAFPAWIAAIGTWIWGGIVVLFTGGGTGEPGGGVDWLTLGLQVVGALTGTSTLLSAFSPAGRKAIGVVADPNAKWSSTIKALGNVATFGAVPPPASVKES